MESLKSIARRVIAGDVPPPEDATREQRRVFRVALEALAASYRHELMTDAIRVYWFALKDIPLEIRHEGMSRCAATLKFFPTVAELRTACCDVVDERRKRAAVEGQRIREECLVCHGNGWQNVTVNGLPAVARCDCWTRAKHLVDAAGQAITRPLLAAVQEEDS